MRGFVHSPLRLIAIGLALVAALTACGEKVDKGAAADVVVLLAAAQSGNRTIFEERIDRAALRDDLRAQLTQLPGVKELQAELGEGMAEGALDRMIAPEVVRRLADDGDGEPDTVAAISPRLKSIGKDRVCLRDREHKDRCLLTFARLDNRWKLVGIYATRQSFEPSAAGRLGEASAEDAD